MKIRNKSDEQKAPGLCPAYREGQNRLLFIKICLLFFLLAAGQWSFAQSTMIYTSEDADFRTALELFDKQKFAAAQNMFQEYLDKRPGDEKAIEAEYYIAMSAMYLKNPDFEYMISAFIEKYPTHIKALNANLNVGNYYFENSDYKNAIRFYSRVQGVSVRGEQETEAAFKLGYSYFSLKQYDKAQDVFRLIKSGNHRYIYLTHYYSGYIAYLQEDYDQAVADLEKAGEGEGFQSEIHSMIPTIYYRQKRYDEVIRYAHQHGNVDESDNPTLNLLVGDSYYMKEDYPGAAAYLEKYVRSAKGTAEKGALYRLAFSYSKTANHSNAVNYYSKVADGADSLAQMSAYHLGVAYLDMGGDNHKHSALNAFRHARELTFDRNLSELGAVNYAKIAYDIGDFRDAIEGGKFYLANFPSGEYADDVNGILTEAYVNSGDYSSALQYIERVKNKNRKMQLAYQRIAYNQSVEFYNDARYRPAIQMLRKSLTYPLNTDLTNSAHFWLGEIYSLGNKYDSALIYYRQVPNGTREYTETLYGMGYAYYNTRNYPRALESFNAYLQSGTRNEKNRADAQVRLADCYYVSKEYDKALNLYNTAMNKTTPDIEYLYYQKGVVLTALERVDDALRTFDMLINQYPNSKYLDAAYYQKGLINFDYNRKAIAIEMFSKLIREKPNSDFLPFALSKRAIANELLENYPQAIQDYKNIIDKYPTHSAAEGAIQSLQELRAKGQTVSDFDYFRDKFSQANPNSKATIEGDFSFAKVPYDNGNYALAVSTLANFIKKTPYSDFTDDAYYFLGMSHDQLGDRENALANFTKVKGGSYAVRALQRAADIEYERGNYQNAIAKYNEMLGNSLNKRYEGNAIAGLMQSYFRLREFGKVETYASEIYTKDYTKFKSLADLYLGKVKIEQNQYEAAIQQLTKTVKSAQDINGAEAQFLIGYVLRKQKNYTASNNALIDVRNKFESYTEWVYEAFLLLADNYIDLDNKFQAKATLNSIIENTQDAKVKARAQAKLNSL